MGNLLQRLLANDTPQAGNDFEQRATELRARRQQVNERLAERANLESAGQATAAERQESEAELRRLADPITRLDTPPEVNAAAEDRFRAARQAFERAAKDLANFPHTVESLRETAKGLDFEETALRVEQVMAEDKTDAAEMLAAGEQIAKLQERMIERRR